MVDVAIEDQPIDSGSTILLLFVGEHYYPLGGAKDLAGVMASPAHAAAFLVLAATDISYGWAHLVDVGRRPYTVVAEWSRDDEGGDWMLEGDFDGWTIEQCRLPFTWALPQPEGSTSA